MSEPQTVTVLTPGMVCIGPFRHGEGGCLSYWRAVDYGARRTMPWLESICLAEEAILNRLIGFNATTPLDVGDPHCTPTKLAEARNRATALLGYVIGNPEAKWAERNLKKYQDILDKYSIKRERE